MKKAIIAISMLAALVGCSSQPKVMARFVPERYDDFIFENNLMAGRFYGQALEDCGAGQVTSPGVDVWVKTPGALVCNQRYVDELQNQKSYHINWGNGKDCYKVSRSLGAGSSSPIVDGVPVMPVTNFRSHEVLENTPDKVVFVLNYPAWDVNGVQVSLNKKCTIVPDTYFVMVEDTYNFAVDSLVVAAGVNRHPDQNIMEEELYADYAYAIWEGASDQSIEKDPDTRVGVAIVVPGAQFCEPSADGKHALVGKTIKPGETFAYSFGSCWNAGDVKSAADWFKIVQENIQ